MASSSLSWVLILLTVGGVALLLERVGVVCSESSGRSGTRPSSSSSPPRGVRVDSSSNTSVTSSAVLASSSRR